MQRILWKGHVTPGKLEEYIKKHDEIWPEMRNLMKEAGMRNYSIWNHGLELIGYYECEGMDKKMEVYAQHKNILDRWNEHMGGIMQMDLDDSGNVKIYQQVFLMQ